MNAEIIAVGTEILMGDICNTHAQFLSAQLNRFGISVLWHTTVGDNPGRMREAVQRAFSRSDLVVFSGGLGPTKDDLTKELVCETLDIELVKDEETAARIEDYFARLQREMPQNNYKQAMVPKGGTIFPNNHGTAPGCAVEKDGRIAILLPGPPSELLPMFYESVEPYLQRLTGQVILSHNLHLYGVGESRVDELLDDLLQGKNPTVGLYAKEGEVRARVTAKAADAAACEEMMAPVLAEIQARLGHYIYAVDQDGLEHALVAAALRAGKKVAVAESCTGGLVASRIASVPGASNCFDCGVVSYANSIKRQLLGVDEQTLTDFGAVSPQVAQEMADGVRRISGADVGVSTTGIAGPSGGSPQKPVGLVYVGVSTAAGTVSHKLLLGRGFADERQSIRNRAAMFALDAARRAIEKN